jgi:hypothetical protein
MRENARMLWLQDHCAAKMRRVVSKLWSGIATGLANVNVKQLIRARGWKPWTRRQNRAALRDRVDHATNASAESNVDAFSVCVSVIEIIRTTKGSAFRGFRGDVMALGRRADTMLDDDAGRGAMASRSRRRTARGNPFGCSVCSARPSSPSVS